MVKVQKILNLYLFWVLGFFSKFLLYFEKMIFRFWLFWVMVEYFMQKPNIIAQRLLKFYLVKNLSYYLDEFNFFGDFFIFKSRLEFFLTIGRFTSKILKYVSLKLKFSKSSLAKLNGKPRTISRTNKRKVKKL